MAELQDHVAYLSQSIGPRPSGTEEEQQAALYITEQLQSDAGFAAVIEDFNCIPDSDLPRAICSGATVVALIVTFFVDVLVIPAFVLAVVACVLYAAEIFDRPIISRFFTRGVSQNVVAKYDPTPTADNRGRRSRKIVLMAHYDTGKVLHELTGPAFGIIPICKWISFGGMVGACVMLLLRLILQPSGMGGLVFNIISLVILVCAAFPLIDSIIHRASSFNEGANCNASGVALLMEIASRIGYGRTMSASAAEPGQSMASGPVMHGEAAAIASGLVPPHADFIYVEDSAPVPPLEEESSDSPEARLLSAKAAVEALTGRPVSRSVSIDFPPTNQEVTIKMDPVTANTIGAQPSASGAEAQSPQESLVFQEEVMDANGEEVLQAEAVEVSQPAPYSYSAPQRKSSSGSVPDWFKQAQKKAKKSDLSAAPVHRSRYADALDAMVHQNEENQQREQERQLSDTELRLQQMRESIMEVKAPSFKRAKNGDQAEEIVEAKVISEAPAREGSTSGAPMVEAVAEEVAVPRNDEFSSGPVIEEAVDVVEATPAKTPFATEEEIQEVRRRRYASYQTVEDQDHLAENATTQFAPIQVDVDAIRAEATMIPATDDTVQEAVNSPQMEATPRRAPVVEGRNPNRITISETESTGRLSKDAMAAAGITMAEDGEEFSEEVVASLNAAIPSIQETDTAATSAQNNSPRKRARKAQQAQESAREDRHKRSISLPHIGGDSIEFAQDSAFDAVPEEDYSSDKVRNLRSVLPSLSGSIAPVSPTSNAKNELRQSLRTSVPSMSGTVVASADLPDEAFLPQTESVSETVSVAGSFAAASATGAFEPVGDELLENVDPEEIYVEDADDSDYGDTITESGAFSGPGYMDMPKSRAHGLFSRFHRKKKKKKNEELSTQEWLDVDDTFEARSVGAAREGWESFRQDDYEDDFAQDVEEDDAYEPEVVLEAMPLEGQRKSRRGERKAERENEHAERKLERELEHDAQRAARNARRSERRFEHEESKAEHDEHRGERRFESSELRGDRRLEREIQREERRYESNERRDERRHEHEERKNEHRAERDGRRIERGERQIESMIEHDERKLERKIEHEEHMLERDERKVERESERIERLNEARGTSRNMPTKRRSSKPKRRWNGGAFSREQLGRVSTLSEDVLQDNPVEVQEVLPNDPSGKIMQFRNPEIRVEVWFVALGSELAENGGIKAFINEHEQELRGALFVDLEAMGAGNLTLINEEGLYFPHKTSSRMDRIVRKAASPLGMSVGKGKMLWTDSSAAYAMKRGYQALHLAGMEDGKPAYYGQENDVFENVNESIMQQNADFVMELIKSI